MNRYLSLVASTATAAAVAAAITLPAGAADAPSAKDKRQGTEVVPEELISCLRGHGAEPPASIDALKPWIVEHYAANREALNACGVAFGPDEKRPGGAPKKGDDPCGAATNKNDRLEEAVAAKRN